MNFSQNESTNGSFEKLRKNKQTVNTFPKIHLSWQVLRKTELVI